MKSLSMRRFKNPYVALLLALWFFGLVAFPSLAAASLAPSKTSEGTAPAGREADLQAVRRALELKLVAQKLKDYGVSTSEVEARLPRMSDAEVHQIAMLSKKLPQGGDDVIFVGGLVGLLIVILLIILIIKLMHHDVIVR
jgi:Family of unknown function (DUF6627)